PAGARRPADRRAVPLQLAEGRGDARCRGAGPGGGGGLMSVARLRELLPAYAKDLRLNLGSVTSQSQLSEQQLWGAVLASAIASRGRTTLVELESEALEHLSTEAADAARTAAALMSMNNVYYRTLHLLEDEEYSRLRAGLRMNAIANPGVDKVDFELWSVAV